MPRQESKLEYNTFVKGLITEASPLTYPENASLIDENMILNRDGSRQRRAGMKYEPNFVLKEINSIQRFDIAFHSYTWKSVNNNANLDIAVAQVGNILWFYDNNVSPVSEAILNSGASLTLSSASYNRKYNFTDSYGRLIVATGEEKIYIVEYNETLDSISVTDYRLEVRDTFGIDDGLDINLRPFTLSISHLYNLHNQGWSPHYNSWCYPRRILSTDSSGSDSLSGDPISYTYSKLGYYPSNADIISACKLGASIQVKCIGAYSPWELEKLNLGTTEAPKGFVKIDIFNRGVSRDQNSLCLNLTGIPNDETVGGVTSVVSFSGRLFYSLEVTSTNGTDKRSPDLGSMILFSKTTTNKYEYGHCYSDNDPTAEDINDPLDTDGGFIVIPDVGKIYKMVPMGFALYVFSSKGVWEISGGTDSIFSATNQSINKICDFGVVSPTSVVSGESLISFWSSGGIYALSLGPDSLRPTVSNITQNTIQTDYNNIDSVAKNNVEGTYDDIAKQVRWLYREGILPSDKYFNRELVYDLNLQSFYKNKFQEFQTTLGTCPYIIGYLDLSSFVFTDEVENVIVSSDQVIVGVGNEVFTTLRRADQSTQGATKYWIHRDRGTGNKADLTVGGFYDLDYKDWSNIQDTLGNYGKDALAQLLTGYITGGVANLDKKSREITVYLKRTEEGFTDDGSGNLTPIHPSGCYMQAQWEWTNHINAGRWSPEMQVYRLPRPYTPTGIGDPFNYGFTVVKTRNKIRGKGGALSLLFKSEAGKDMHLYGWSLVVSVPSK